MVTCAGTGKAPTCVLHHAKPWDYNKRALSSIHTCFVAPHRAGRQPAQNAAKPADIHRSREGNTMATRFPFTAATWRAHRQQCALLSLVAALCLALPAQASPHRSDTSAAQGAKRKKGGQRVRVPPQRSSSEESPEQRDKRLYRECQGRHNAGACAGYTRPPPGRQRR